MIKLIAFDLDGTTLVNNKEIPQENIQALIDANKKGIHLVPATGRMKTFLPKSLTDLDFIRYAVTSNGGGVYDLKTDECIHSALISHDKAIMVHEIIEKYNIYFEYYLNGNAYTISGNIEDKVLKYNLPEHKRYFFSKNYTYVDNMKEFLRNPENCFQKINLLYTPIEIKEKISQEILAIGDLCLCSSLLDNLEVNFHTATKAKGLEKLCEKLGITKEETMSIGDSGNDVEMLKWANVSVAMGNADDYVKKSAKFTTINHDECGLAKAIYEHAI